MNRKQRRALQQMQNDAAAVLSHPASMRFLCRVLAEVGYYDDPAVTLDTNATFKSAGQQEAGRKIVRALQSVDEDALLKLLETAAKQRNANVADEGRQNNDE